MAGQQRKCANCRFFSDAGMSGNGWCTHPKRQLSSGVKLLVRGGELACRNSWGGDLFQSRLDDDASTPASADLPGAGDDQVTSVTIPQARPAETEDRVVADRPAARRPLSDANDPAHRDQDERARIMARGSRDALAHARERISSRRRAEAGNDVVDDDNMPANGGEPADRVVTRQARFSDRFLAPSGMPPMRAEPVPREEINRRGAVPRDRFDTVPEIDPAFDPSTPVDAPEARAAEPPPVDEPPDEIAQTTYEHMLQRARRTRVQKQGQARPIRHADLRIGRVEDDPNGAWEPDRRVAASLAEATGPLDTGAPWEDAPVWIEEADDAEPLAAEAAWDELPDHGEPERWDENDEWDDVESVVAPPQPRRSWRSRFGFGHGAGGMLHDDATVTRHAAQHEAWDEEPAPADAWHTPASRNAARDAPETAAADRWPDLPEDDDLPAWNSPARQPAPPERWLDPLPAARRREDRVEPVPAASHAVPPSVPAAARQQAGSALPDLDDALFDEPAPRPRRVDRVEAPRTERRAAQEPNPPATHARSASDLLQSRSPRDSAFRASRFSDPDVTTGREPLPAVAVPPPVPRAEIALPDLDATQIDVRDAVARGDEQVAREIEIAPEIPRQCRTCRSFHSADGGTRGWCTNEYAFTHRRMVNDDDLACRSSIGCWWLPADDWRMDLDDESDDVPTPRMDELIARNRPAARRASGE